jgi:hypothetical protein
MGRSEERRLWLGLVEAQVVRVDGHVQLYPSEGWGLHADGWVRWIALKLVHLQPHAIPEAKQIIERMLDVYQFTPVHHPQLGRRNGLAKILQSSASQR